MEGLYISDHTGTGQDTLFSELDGLALVACENIVASTDSSISGDHAEILTSNCYNFG